MHPGITPGGLPGHSVTGSGQEAHQKAPLPLCGGLALMRLVQGKCQPRLSAGLGRLSYSISEPLERRQGVAMRLGPGWSQSQGQKDQGSWGSDSSSLHGPNSPRALGGPESESDPGFQTGTF